MICMMNKLVIDNNNYSINNFEGEIEILNDAIISLSGNNNIIIKNLNHDITFNIIESSNSVINVFTLEKKKSSNAKVNIKKNSSFKLVSSYISIKTLKDNYEINVDDNNNYVELIVNAITKEKTDIIASVNVKKSTKNNEVLENIKAYEDGGCALISPLLLVNTNEVVANHKAVITNLANEDMFYLKSHGLSEKECFSLIKEGILIKDFNQIFKEKIRKEFYE